MKKNITDFGTYVRGIYEQQKVRVSDILQRSRLDITHLEQQKLIKREAKEMTKEIICSKINELIEIWETINESD